MVSWKTKLKLAWWTRGNWGSLFKCYKCCKSCKKNCCACCTIDEDSAVSETTETKATRTDSNAGTSTSYGAASPSNEGIGVERKKSKKLSKQSPLLGKK